MEHYTRHIVNLACTGGDHTHTHTHTHRFAVGQRALNSSVYKFAVSRGPCCLAQCTCIAVNINFLLTIFNWGAGKFYFSARSSYDMPVKAQSGGRSVVPTHSQPGDSIRWVVSTTLRPFYPHERSGIHCTGVRVSLGASLDGTGSLSSPGFNPRTVQSVANHYTDCAISVAFSWVSLHVLFE
jgi:hypothetical protein